MKRFVKSLFLVFVLMIGVFVLTGCGKTGNTTQKVETANEIDSQIIGTWELDEDGYTATYVLNADGTGSYTLTVEEDSDVKELTYKTENNKLLVTFKGDTDVFESEYSFKDNNTLGIKDSFGEEFNYVRK